MVVARLARHDGRCASVTREFCTYFDHRYLSRALVLHETLTGWVGDFRLWALCMDTEAEKALERLNIDSIVIVPLRSLEAYDPGLLTAKANRSLIEYYFTCTPVLPRYALASDKAIDEITYLDADLFLMGSVDSLFDEMDDRSVSIVPHRFPPGDSELEQHGVYNVGWMTFRRTDEGQTVLDWWRDRCIEWCYDRPEDGKFADQGYHTDWPTRFRGVHVIRNPGANLAPWNLRTHLVSEDNGRLQADGHDVIFYHVHGLRKMSGRAYRLGLGPYSARLTRPLKQLVYRPYIAALEAADRRVDAVLDIPREIRRPMRSFGFGLSPAGLVRMA